MMTEPFGPQGFTEADIQPQLGKTYAITGANSGIGLEAARYLGRAGATVLLLCRQPQKAAAAVADLERTDPQGAYRAVSLDLASLKSVNRAADEVAMLAPALDALILNAGVMFPPKRQLTEDGFELQFGVNFLGHFALAARLHGNVLAAEGRHVWVSSIAHHYARSIPFEDLDWSRRYSPLRSYAVSKLADLMGGIELQRRLTAAGSPVTSFIAHPGYSDTNLQYSGPGRIAAMIARPLNALIAQPAAKGALPSVLCATSPLAEPGRLYGPTGLRELKGPVREAVIKPQALNEAAAKRLWTVAEEKTGIAFSV